MTSAPRPALTLAVLALLAGGLISGCGGAGSGSSATVAPESVTSQLVDQAKENAGPAERAYMDEHRKALEAATGIELPDEPDEPASEEVEYGEDGQPVGSEEGEAQQEYDESGEPVEART